MNIEDLRLPWLDWAPHRSADRLNCLYENNVLPSNYKTLQVYTYMDRLIRHIPDEHFAMVAAKEWISVYL